MTSGTLPWPTIASEVKAAVRAYAKVDGQQPFVLSARQIAEFVRDDGGRFPHLTDGCNFVATQTRCTGAMKRLGWRKWSSSGHVGTKFIIPWGDQPYCIKEVKR